MTKDEGQKTIAAVGANARTDDGRIRLIHRTNAVALSNAALPAAAWYFPTVVRFSLCERKNEQQKKIKYRCE